VEKIEPLLRNEAAFLESHFDLVRIFTSGDEI
jgi:hypothetical protein